MVNKDFQQQIYFKVKFILGYNEPVQMTMSAYDFLKSRQVSRRWQKVESD